MNKSFPHATSSLLTIALGLCLDGASILQAQDRRVVTEPHAPPVCQRLKAAQYASDLAADGAETLDTQRLQAALERCGAGRAVELIADGAADAFLSGPISIPASTTLLIDRGVTLFASRDAALYAFNPGSCGLVSQEGNGCRAFISILNASHAAIMGDGAIDGQGGRRIVGKSQSWWDLAEAAHAGGRQQVPRLIVTDHSDDLTFYNITLRNSPNFHLVPHGAKGVTVWGVKIDTPKTARNTDGIDPGDSSDITVTHTYIRTGDDNIAIKGSGSGVQHMSVIDNHFYYGHGMSIGSETFGGVSDLLVQKLSLDGTDSGIRIKSNVSRGGLVDRATYQDVCIRDNKAPVAIDALYNNPGPRQDLVPEYRHILLRNVRISGGGKITIQGSDEKHRTSITLDGVLLDQPSAYRFSVAHADIVLGPGPVNFRLSGPDVTVNGSPANGKPESCAAMMAAFPGPVKAPSPKP